MTAYSEHTYSVGQLHNYIQTLLQNDRQLRQVWVTGEVSSTSEHPKGLFFTVKDNSSDVAINCVVWNSLRSKLIQQPKKGEQLLVLASIRIYQKRGELQLNVLQVIPQGQGLEELQYQQLRSRLTKEGLFDSQRKRPIPTFAQTVAVVTSPTAAAWGDIKRTLQQRAPGLHILFSPATVQGNNAPLSIIAALERVKRDGRAQVLILARGGGAVEDLSCFNDERLVRAIATCAIPVITGIGHNRDESLADLVADVSVHTPTAAAEIATPDYAQLLADSQQKSDRLLEALKRRINKESERLQQLRNRLIALPSISRTLTQQTAKCLMLREKLVALDPQRVLTRGYAVVKKDNTLIRSTTNLNLEDELIIQLGQGRVRVKITEILP